MSDNPYRQQIIQGEILFREGQHEKALEIFEDVLQKDPDNAEALNNAGVVYLELHRVEEAINTLHQSLTIHPGNENSFFTLIDCYLGKGNEAEAGQIYQLYEKHIPESATKKEYQDALAPLLSEMEPLSSPGIATNPEVTRGEDLFQKGLVEDAAKVFKQLLEHEPGNVDALNNLGVIAVQKNQFSEAVDYFLQGLKNEPRHPDLLTNIESLVVQQESSTVFEEKLQEYLDSAIYAPQHRNIMSLLSRLLDCSTDYRAAQKTLDITPPVSEDDPVLLQGFAGPPREARSSLTPLTMQLLLLEDREYNKSLIISADLFGFGSWMVEKIREVARPWGIPPEAIILNASHTHYAPGTVENVPDILGPYYEMYAKAIVQSVAGAFDSLYETLEPCYIYSGQTEAQIGISRRVKQDGKVIFGENPDGYYEKHTPILVIDLIQSSRTVVLINHGCHPTGYGAHNQVSADYPAYAREFLKKSPALDEVMFLQGAAGSSKGSVGNNGTTHFTQRPEEVAQNGIALATEIETLLAEPLHAVTGTIFATKRNIELALQKIPTSRELSQIKNSAGNNGLIKQWVEHFEQLKSEEIDTHLSLEMQLLTLGSDVAFLTLPGEPVAELGRKLLDEFSKTINPFLLGYTNGLKAYLPTAEQVREGGYESDTSRLVYLLPGTFNESIEDQLIESTRDLLKVHRKSTKPNGYGRYHLRKKTGSAFFTLSSGRCGTKTLAHILNTATNARVYHHPLPYLVDETLQAYHATIDKSRTFWQARKGVIQDAWKDDLIFGELDHNMTPFATTIAKEIPEAKFIVLVRNPWDFVRSGMRRNYYNGHPWDSGRLHPEPHHPDFERWQTMSQFEKVCWLWNETYSRIQDYLETIPEEHYRVIRFEDLIKNPEVPRDLFQFLGLKGFDAGALQSVLSSPLNKQTHGIFPKPGAWAQKLHQQLVEYCGDTIEKYHYGDLIKQYESEQSKKISKKQGQDLNKKICVILEEIGFKDYGRSEEGYPYVELTNGLKFYGLPDITRLDVFELLSDDLQRKLHPDIIEIILNVHIRYFKKMQHKFYTYQPGDVVVELGAYLGYYAMSICEKVGPEGKVLAVEIVPENYEVLQKNFTENFPETGIAVQRGIWNKRQEKEVYIGGTQINSFRKDVVTRFKPVLKKEMVDADTVDNILREHNISDVDLMIVQINGNEIEAMEGMQLSLPGIKNLTIVATYDRLKDNSNTEILHKFLTENGYQVKISNETVYAHRNGASETPTENTPDPILVHGMNGDESGKRTDNKKILFLEQEGISTGGHLDHIVHSLRQNNRIEYLKTADLQTAQEAIRQADVIWLEWASQLTATVTRKVPELQSKPVICRLHGFEVFTPLPAQINWTVVDKLIFVANHKRDLFNQRFPKVDVDQVVIRNGVNIDRFSIPEKKQNTKNLLLLGHINYRKGLTLLLQFYHELLKKDPDFDLYIRGDWQDLRYKMAVMTMVKELGLENKVTFVEEWIDDLNAWLADKSHILSFSLEESFHYAIGNGMAAGMKPVIHAWNESRDIWPEEFIFNDLEGFLQVILDKQYEPVRYRGLLKKHQLDQSFQLKKIQEVISGITLSIPEGSKRTGRDRQKTRPTNLLNKGTYWQDERGEKIALLHRELDKFLPITGKRLTDQSRKITPDTYLRTIKCERLGNAENLWEVELEILFSEAEGLIVQFLFFDSNSEQLFLPSAITLEKSVREKWVQLIKDCLKKPDIRLNKNLLGCVFDSELMRDIKENFQEYLWERMYPGTVFTPYKKFIRHMVRYNFVRQFIQPVDAVIDAACGIGYGTRYLAPLCRQINGVDISDRSLSFGKVHYHSPNISWLKANVMELPVESEKIDHFISMETFEHIHPVAKFLQEINRVLRPGGYAFISTPNGGSESRKNINNPYHEHEYTFAELSEILGTTFPEYHIKGLKNERQIIEVHEENADAVFSFLCLCRKH